MRRWTRRKFGCLAGAGFLAAFSSRPAEGQAKARVVVIGGGVGGTAVAKYLATSATALDVTLIEPKRQYTTCFFSNLYLAGLLSFESLTHRYETLAQRYGIAVVHDTVTAIDPVARSVRVKGGAELPYDYAVVAPGIAFEYGAIEGYDEAATETMPHAWNAGRQTALLRRQLESMEDGGVFVLVAPPEPSRCPPGPYERASLIAYYFKQHKPHSKILILDAKDSFVEQELFQDGWNRHCPGMIEWLPRQFTGGTKAVDVKARSVETASETFSATVANIIPPQLAGRLAQQAGLADPSGWCPVDPMTFESKLQPGIYVVGDATTAGAMPKAAFAANSQAKVCASAIVAALTGYGPFTSHLFSNCFTFLAPDDAVSNVISFKPTDGTLKISNIFVSKVGENAEARRQTAHEAERWYASFTHHLFG